MSQSQQSATRPASERDGYSRYDWWGDDVDDDEQTTGHDPDEFDYTSEKASWLAHDYLKGTARILCATTLFAAPCLPGGETERALAELFGEQVEHDELAVHQRNEEIELSEPKHYKPAMLPEATGSRVGHRHAMTRSRVNDEHGYLGGLYIADQPREDFMNAMNGLIDWWAAVEQLRDEKVNKLRRDARRMKETGSMRDVEIVESLLADVMNGTIMEDDN